MILICNYGACDAHTISDSVLRTMNYKFVLRNNALVICDHGPTPPRNSGDFDFWSSKYPLKAPPCGDSSLMKPLLFPPQPTIFSFHGPFCLYKANPEYFPRTAEAKLWSKPRSVPWLSPTLPQGAWLQMARA